MSANEDALREIGERMVRLHGELAQMRTALRDARNNAFEEAAAMVEIFFTGSDETVTPELRANTVILAQAIRQRKVAP